MFQTQIVSHCAKTVFLQNFGGVKNEVFEKKLHLLSFLGEIETEKMKSKEMEKAKNPIKILFLRRASKNVKTQKMDF